MIIDEGTYSLTTIRHHSSTGGQMLIVIIKSMSQALVGFLQMFLVVGFGAKN